jgi:hypothetical protein
MSTGGAGATRYWWFRRMGGPISRCLGRMPPLFVKLADLIHDGARGGLILRAVCAEIPGQSLSLKIGCKSKNLSAVGKS